MEMQKKLQNSKTSNLTNERKKTFVQTYIFDPYNYQQYFDVTESEILNKLLDALWPFIPENQHHLIKIDSESVREFKTRK